MQTRRLWRRGAALAGGLVVGFVCVSALRRTPYDAPTKLTRWYEYERPAISSTRASFSPAIAVISTHVAAIDECEA